MNDTTTAGEHLSMGAITRFWFPLALTWLMMAAEGPFLAAIIARLHDPKSNLAAWGVAFGYALTSAKAKFETRTIGKQS